jgi:4-aminobutyrate aminotransferase-like enzyme
MIEKWRGYNLFLKKQAFFIARRVPLKWEKKNIKRTIDIIEKALKDLKNMDLLED